MSIRPRNDRLSVDDLRSMLDYDPDTGVIRWRWRENIRKCTNARLAGKVAGTRKKGYVQIVIYVDGRAAFFGGHRIAWALHYGAWPEDEVDHEDGDPANNRIKNLRAATHSQNGVNRSAVHGVVPFRGVSLFARSGRYGAQIKTNQQHTWLGLFDDPVEAARAYDREAVRQHGEFAKTNVSLGLLAPEHNTLTGKSLAIWAAAA